MSRGTRGKSEKLRRYRAYDARFGPDKCSVFVETLNSAEARLQAAPLVQRITGCEWGDVRVKWIKEES